MTKFQLRLAHYMFSTPQPLLFKSTIVNDGRMTGLLICYWMIEVAFLHVYSADGDVSIPDVDTTPIDDDARWLYIPLSRGQWLSDIWLRRDTNPWRNTLIVSKKRETRITSRVNCFSWCSMEVKHTSSGNTIVRN